MNKIAFAFLPLLAAAFIIPDDSCRQKNPFGTYHTEQFDGPYVLYSDAKIFIKYIHDSHGAKLVKADSIPISEKASLSLTVLTDEPGKTFTVKLKSQLQNEKTDFSNVSKQFVVSDIEGNFKAQDNCYSRIKS